MTKKEHKVEENQGEFFTSRGMGLDTCKCFVCQTEDRTGHGHAYLNNIAAFVENREAGERVVALFIKAGSTARLDFRPREPNWVQVKVGACDIHKPNLEKLGDLVRPDRKITLEKIQKAMKS